jgi:glycerophosphoryl diester phosphodiesterase
MTTVTAQSVLEKIYSGGRMLVFGHRGASAYAPMNTLPAFELAALQGADGVELDVHFSKDKQLIVLHDFTVDHTTNGAGFARDMTLAELKALDAGSKKDPKFAGVQIPTLDEVFAAVGQKLYVNVEIKSETEETDGVEQAVADCLARNNMTERVIVSSFNPLALKRFREIMPHVPIGYLYMADFQPAAEVMASLPHEARHPHHPMIDLAYMEWAKSNGYRVNTWTVNNAGRALELRDLGVDAVITDTPDVMLEALRG